MEYDIKPFGVEHIREAAEIEALSFSDPWSEGGLLMLTREGAAAYACVERSGGRLAAFAGMVTVLDEGQIVNVATHPDFRRRGCARSALRALIYYADAAGIVLLSLEVRETNSAAIALYLSEGFYVAGRRPAFYRNPSEAALVMLREKTGEK